MTNINTQFGFEWGPVKVIRHCSDDKKGWVIFGIKTKKKELQVYVTKTGKIRVYRYCDEKNQTKRELK